MKSAAATLRRALLAWYRRAARPLPWRTTRDPYRIWLSEILLQQTRVETGLPYYERFVETLPTVQALAAAPLDRVLKLWEGLGYYTRARNLHRAAWVIVHERGGTFPRSAAEWQTLPGIGRYTAGAIASITAGEPVPAVDGNVKRVLARLWAVRSSVDSAATVAKLWRRASELVPRRAPGDFNQALMELGARICTPRAPRCDECPVASACRARAAGLERELPVRRARRAVPEVDAVAAILESRGRLLLAQRPAGGLLGGLWGWPTYELANGAPHAAVLADTLRVALGTTVAVGAPLGTVRHEFSHRRLHVHVYMCRLARRGADSRVPRSTSAAGMEPLLRWVRRSELELYAWAAVDRKILTRFATRPAH